MRHENTVIANMAQESFLELDLEFVLNFFLEISFDPDWRDNVRNTVWNKPRITRSQLRWSQPQREAIAYMIDQYEWLAGYEFGGCGKC